MTTDGDSEHSRDVRRDLEATIEARRELGAEYDHALTQAFVDKLDREVARRVAVAVAEERHHAVHGGYPIGLAYASLGVGIPITAIAGGIAQVPGLAVAWAGIALVNLAAALGTRRRPPS